MDKDQHASNEEIPPIKRKIIITEWAKGRPIKEIAQRAGLDLVTTMKWLKRIQKNQG